MELFDIAQKLETSSPLDYQTRKPFPYLCIDDVLEPSVAKKLQEEILNIPDQEFDRYDNPFEQKFTLRNKNNYPPQLQDLINYLTDQSFLNTLSNLVGYELINDSTKNFYGIHKYKNGDKLDIHVDAGKHPQLGLKKQVTIGLYLSKDWKEEYGCQLELWQGDNAKNNDAKIYQCIEKIAPIFNRMVIFTNDDYSWHGNPEPAVCPDTSTRIFVTLSYMSNNQNYENKKQKAFFIARPNDPPDLEKDKLRLIRADPERYKEIYRYNSTNNKNS